MAFINLPLNKKGKERGCTNIESDICQTFAYAIGKPSKFEHIGELSVPTLQSTQSVSKNAFVATVHKAFAEEIGLVLCPDHFWNIIMQGVAEHVNRNAAYFHNKFVTQPVGTKKDICIRNDQLVRYVKTSPWNLCFPDFETALNENIVGGTDGLLPAFSTSTETTQICSVIALMDVVKSYFSYKVFTMCGIPKIELSGTAQDWDLLYSSAENLLARVEMKTWWSKLQIILQNCKDLFAGVKNVAFWSQIYLFAPGQSGRSDTVSGWIKYLFPYILSEDGESEDCETELSLNSFDDKYVPVTAFPNSLNRVPFVWNYFGKEFQMNFYAGIVGIGLMNNGKSLTPSIGWAVAYQNEADCDIFQNGEFFVKSVDDFELVAKKTPYAFIFKSASKLSRRFVINAMCGDEKDQEEKDAELKKVYGDDIMNAALEIRRLYKIVTADYMNCEQIKFELK